MKISEFGQCPVPSRPKYTAICIILIAKFVLTYSISVIFILILNSLGWFGVLGVFGFFIISTVVNKFVMGPIVNYVFLQEWREGDFR